MNKWDIRFSSKDFFYGEKPNTFFAEYLSSLSHKGKLLLPGEGEGRNAIFAAKLGWEVHAFDSSKVARQKAIDFAASESVSIKYDCLDLKDFVVAPQAYDMAAMIFVHMPEELRKDFHHKVMQSIKKGGIVFIESFAKEQINNNSGGPANLEMLHSTEILKSDFPGLSIIKLCQQQVHLEEGHHRGKADVIRFVGMKP